MSTFNDLQLFSSLEENTLNFLPTHLSESSLMEDPYMFNEDYNNQEFYYYYNNQLTTSDESTTTTLMGIVNNNNNNNDLLFESSLNTLNLSPLSDDEFQNNQNYIINNCGGVSYNPYLYNDNNNIIDDDDTFDTYNPFLGQQSSICDDPDSFVTPIGDNTLLLTQPLSEVTQNVIENHQSFHSYNWCDLSPYPDVQQQYIFDNNISTKIAEQNQQNLLSSENRYTPWTDFQLLES